MLIEMDLKEVQVVTSRPTPSNHEQLQWFLGFANFYRKLIRGFSTIAAPLHRLTLSSISFTWTPEADEAFRCLRCAFTSTPVLMQPNPERQFVVEVDASDDGVGAVLTQWSATDNKIHPCAFFSKKQTFAERNCSVGDQEFLAIKVALEEWCHWLEGSPQPLVVLADQGGAVHCGPILTLFP